MVANGSTRGNETNLVRYRPFKSRLVTKGYTLREGVDYEETFSPVAMLKSIRILLSITTFYDYEIWQMDVKTTFLNSNLEKSIYMAQLEGFIEQDHEQKVCKLKRSIYGLKKASRSWNIRFDTAIKSYGFKHNVDDPYVYKKIVNSTVVFMVLYVDDILLIGNDVGFFNNIKHWLATQFQMLVVPNMHLPITLYCDSSGAVANYKEPRSHKRGNILSINIIS